METLQVASCIRGNHIYKTIWKPTVEELNCVQETTNGPNLSGPYWFPPVSSVSQVPNSCLQSVLVFPSLSHSYWSPQSLPVYPSPRGLAWCPSVSTGLPRSRLVSFSQCPQSSRSLLVPPVSPVYPVSPVSLVSNSLHPV